MGHAAGCRLTRALNGFFHLVVVCDELDKGAWFHRTAWLDRQFASIGTCSNTVPAPNFLNSLSEILTDVVFLSKNTTQSQIGDSLMSSVTQARISYADRGVRQ